MAPAIITRYVEPGLVKLVWHDFTWIGEGSRQAAQAAHCAGRQGRFWEYHDALYVNQRAQFSGESLRAFAVTVGLDTSAFSACLDRGEDLNDIRASTTAARELGVTATPTFFINGRRLLGAPLDVFVREIEAERARLGR